MEKKIIWRKISFRLKKKDVDNLDNMGVSKLSAEVFFKSEQLL